MPEWKKSSACNADGCVEVAAQGTDTLIRDSKLGDNSPVIQFNEDEWLAFRKSIIMGLLPGTETPLD